MKRKDLEKVRSKEVDALKKEVAELKLQRNKAIADISAGKESNLKKAKQLKKEIVQYLTIITEKEVVKS